MPILYIINSIVARRMVYPYNISARESACAVVRTITAAKKRLQNLLYKPIILNSPLHLLHLYETFLGGPVPRPTIFGLENYIRFLYLNPVEIVEQIFVPDRYCLKKNLNASRPFEHLPQGEKMLLLLCCSHEPIGPQPYPVIYSLYSL